MLEHRIPEQPTTPPELAANVESACRWIFAQTLNTEKSAAYATIRRILTTSEGCLRSYNNFGQAVRFDAGDIWDALTENEESADLAPVAGALIWFGDLNAAKRAQGILTPALDHFVATHAERVAQHEVRQHLANRRSA